MSDEQETEKSESLFRFMDESNLPSSCLIQRILGFTQVWPGNPAPANFLAAICFLGPDRVCYIASSESIGDLERRFEAQDYRCRFKETLMKIKACDQARETTL